MELWKQRSHQPEDGRHGNTCRHLLQDSTACEHGNGSRRSTSVGHGQQIECRRERRRRPHVATAGRDAAGLMARLPGGARPAPGGTPPGPWRGGRVVTGRGATGPMARPSASSSSGFVWSWRLKMTKCGSHTLVVERRDEGRGKSVHSHGFEEGKEQIKSRNYV
jgi:hypothetical protein